MRIEGHRPHVGRATKGGSLPYNSSNRNGAKAPRVTIDFPAAPVHESTWLEIGPRYYVHSACAADLAAADDLLMIVTRFASPGPIFYRQKRVGLGGRHFSYLEVPDNEGEC